MKREKIVNVDGHLMSVAIFIIAWTSFHQWQQVQKRKLNLL